MKNNWSDPNIAKAWAKAVSPTGDLFQRTLTNPFIVATAAAVNAGHFPPTGPNLAGETKDAVLENSHSFEWYYSEELSHIGTASDFSTLADALEEYEKKICKRDFSNVHCVDLGAGEGYLGRLFGASLGGYTGIDSSKQLLAKAKKRGRPLGLEKWLPCDLDVEGRDQIDRLVQFLDANVPAPLPNLVVCAAVLDHLFHPEGFLTALRRWLGQGGVTADACLGRAVALVTLNPDFFFGPRGWSSAPSSPSQPSPARLGPAKQWVEVMSRSWMAYERLFSAAGFHVLWCFPTALSQAPPFLRERYLRAADLPTGDGAVVPAAGPFVFWVLIPFPLGHPTKLTRNTSAARALQNPLRDEGLDPGELAALKEIGGVTEHRFTYRYPVCLAHNLSSSCLYVEEGTVVMSRNGARKQTFGPGDFIGELESGGDPFASRFLYPLHVSSPDGATLIRIPLSEAQRVLSSPQQTVSGRLFTILRDRVSTYSWIYHKSAAWRRRVELDVRAGKSERISSTGLEHCARALLFAATLESGRGKSSNGLTIVVTLEELFGLMRDRVKGGGKKGDEPTFDRELCLLSALGIVEALSTSQPADELRRVCKRAWSQLVKTATTIIIAEGDQSLAGKTGVVDEIDSPQGGHPLAFDGTGQLHSQKDFSMGRLTLTETSKAPIGALRRTISQACGAAFRERRFLHWLGNLIWLKHLAFRKGGAGPVFVHINDMHFLRRLASYSDEEQADLVARARRSPYVKAGRPVSYSAQFHDVQRLEAFFQRVVNYVAAKWTDGLDLCLSTDLEFERTPSIERFVDHYESKSWGA